MWGGTFFIASILYILVMAQNEVGILWSKRGRCKKKVLSFLPNVFLNSITESGCLKKEAITKEEHFFPQLFKNRIDYHLKRHEKTKRRQLIKELLNVAASGILQDNCQSLLTANLGV